MESLYTSAITILLSGFLGPFECGRIRRAYSDNFNVLLDIYKLNPLKDSNAYRAFSNTVILTNKEDPFPSHTDSGESHDIEMEQLQSLHSQSSNNPIDFLDSNYETTNRNHGKLVRQNQKPVAYKSDEVAKVIAIKNKVPVAETFFPNYEYVVPIGEPKHYMSDPVSAEVNGINGLNNNFLDEILMT